MEFKGTKGKWGVSEDINDKDRVCIEDESNNNFIDCWSLNFCNEEQMKANAKLIASAPELLKASIKMSEAISTGNNHLLSEANLELKEAINKALN